jgi:Cellulase (glycosyl hydrolase family 5)
MAKAVVASKPAQASFVIATIIPISTTTTIAICIQIQVGDIASTAYLESNAASGSRRAAPIYSVAMMRGLRTSAMALALVLCPLVWLVPAGESKLARRAQSSAPPLGGVNVEGPFPGATLAYADREIAEAHQLHAKVVRAEVPWSVLEPSGPGQISPSALAFTDRLMADAAADGIGVILFVDSTPCWASSAPASLLQRCVPGESSAANGWAPSNPADFAAIVAYLAGRYGTHLTAIEVWNEPDQVNQRYFAGPEKPQRYAALLRAAYTAIKQANPNVLVLGGSLVGANGVFLRALYAAGIMGYYDGLAVHFYTLTLASLRAFHEVQVANGDSKPLWLDEFGWSDCYPKHRIQEELPCVTAQVQARNITDLFHALSHTSYVAADLLYELQDEGGDQFGVLSVRGKRKPAFAALAQVLASPSGEPRPVTLSLRRRGGVVVASGSGPVGDYMELEAFRGSLLRYRALFTLDRFDRYSITLPRVLGTHGLRVRVYQYWAGLGKAAQKRI